MGRMRSAHRLYIFHSSHVATTASQVIQSNGSDHYCVVSTLSMAKKFPGTARRAFPNEF